jgi:hypothetical protein
MEGNGNHPNEEENMIGTGRASLRKLADRTLLSRNRLAAEAGIYTQTLKRALDGERVQRPIAVRITSALNRLLGTDYEPEDIDGLRIVGESEDS